MNLMRIIVQVTYMMIFFIKEEEIITSGSIVWVNTNKTIWEGRFINIPFSDFSEDAKNLKLIRINTKK